MPNKLKPKHIKHPRPKKSGRKKKKLSLFYGLTSSIAIIGLITIFYFVVLVSTKPRSILIVTQKIETVLQDKFGRDNVSIDRSHLGFTNYGSLKITVSGLRILHPTPDATTKESFIIPRLETEFSLFDFLLLRFHPSKIKILNPNIFLGNWHKLAKSDQEEIIKKNDLSLLAGLLTSIQTGDNPIEDLEIENAKLMIRDKNLQREILLKKAQIHISNKGNNLTVSSQNKLSLDAGKTEITLSSTCQIANNTICDLSLQNLSPDSLAEFHPNLKDLSKVNAALSANISFALQNGEFNDLKFKIHSKEGNFEVLDFFEQKMHFRNFSITGGYDHQNRILDLSEVKTDFVDAVNPTNRPNLNMSLLVAEEKNTKERKLDFNIKFKNISGDEIKKFWPVTLSNNGIRDWVSKHIKNGKIADAHAKFTLAQIEKDFYLKKISSELSFAGINLKYDESFPEIKNINATAKFTRKNMKIAISSGDVLQSKISNGLVEIDDFEAKNVMLKISGKSSGDASNTLQHANNDPEFIAGVAKYLNGNSKNNFDIRLHLSRDITLKNSYISVNSKITGLENEYLDGDVTISSKKKFDSPDFVTKIDLTASKFNENPLGLDKELSVESKLKLLVSVNSSNRIQLKNITLRKKVAAHHIEKFDGSFSFKTSPFSLQSAYFKNYNFSRNHYLFTYHDNGDARRILWHGERINLGALLMHRPESNGKFPDLTVEIAANHADLLRKKKLRGLYIALNCTNGFCSKALAKANYGKKHSLNLRINKKQNNIITGEITDIGYIAEGLGISKVISGGKAKLEMSHYAINKQPVLKGTMVIDDEITIYEHEAVKNFSKNTLFSQIRDKIFSSDKTIFDSVNIEFKIENHLLDIQSLVANNYKIGVTAKGKIDLSNDSFHLKGMIVPGFIVNNLFGIGKIPLVGGVISGLLTGGEGGGLFGIRYEYEKSSVDKEAKFTTNKVAAFIPSTIQNLFD